MSAKDDWAEIIRDNSGIPEVSAEWVAENREGAAWRLIDIREANELVSALGNIEGHEHIPMGDVPDAAEDWDTDAALVIYCRSGGRSGRIAQLLEDRGFERVASMAGGMLRWNALGYPLG